ncbi:hypothetical protein E3T34_02495 [Cryobacterium sp. TMT1-62]|uniref:hypothetical protein n=1 Tax=unclassified Cryobacterium TaxID=2649013 RepID=UPI000CE3A0DE|nr:MULTISPECIES: hypothetical protein [unclassified Cryobacterium]TFB54587.1 hypothetical protein E3N94_12415 [Cryobacterium sp. Sr3]TFC33654.1 hypothetical protein E3O28_13605 [Cryobacterium sp. TMT2-14]TFC47699.1 hypothetical protein E3O47_14845 [Cryobacterium sp. TMT2-17-1]TFC71040.1 hypothetical protein E3O54_01830 [Cryobacterium sp. TMT2-4]TFD34840.1 hypothetical protein E3T40_09510 [Cryobacterium sp. TMT1-19]
MISIDSARALAEAGLQWRPVSGDAFRIERSGFESDVFTVSDMTIEPHEFDTGTILGFNGTTEWALDSLALEDALWMPREDQLRDLLRSTFRSLTRQGEDSYRVTVALNGAPEFFDAADPADAYGNALLRLISLSADSLA